MGCISSTEKYKRALIQLTKQPEQEIKKLIEQIIINTQYNEKDIYFLYLKFRKLEPSQNGLISNNQLLELPEFKFCPFRKHLKRVFNLEENKNEAIPNAKEEDGDYIQSQEEDNENKNISHNHSESINNPAISSEKRQQNNNFLGSIDRKPIQIRRDTYIQIPIIVGRQHISFKKFCEIMKVFNNKCEVDVKIKFYFDIYDVDGDGKITKNDLIYFLRIINTNDENDKIKVFGEKDDADIENFIEPMIEMIMRELITSSTRQHIDYREFRRLMWHTNIDKACVIYLEEE